MIGDLEELPPGADARVVVISEDRARAVSTQQLADATVDLVASKQAGKHAKISGASTFATSAAPLSRGANLTLLMV